MTDSNDCIGELEGSRETLQDIEYKIACGKLSAKAAYTKMSGIIQRLRKRLDKIGDYQAADERAAWADHFKVMGWAPPEEVEELRRDAERHRWLEARLSMETLEMPAITGDGEDKAPQVLLISHVMPDSVTENSSIPEAIDEAMSKDTD